MENLMEPNYIVTSPKDPLDVKTFEEAVAEIESSLFNLRYLTAETDFDNEQGKTRFRDNIVSLKRFYERAERIALNEQTNSSGADGGVGQKASEKNVKVLVKKRFRNA